MAGIQDSCVITGHLVPDIIVRVAKAGILKSLKRGI